MTGFRSMMPRRATGASILALAALLLGCTGHGGGYLPPAPALMFAEQATLGFSFSCERSSRSVQTNPPTGQLRLQLSYTDHGANPLGTAFAVHGTADELDPVLESQVCIGQEPAPENELGQRELIFLGRYRLTSGAPPGFPRACAARNSQCRFEVIVRDNDRNRVPSTGDFFSITLSTVTDEMVTQFAPNTVFYTRAGLLAGGNLEVN